MNLSALLIAGLFSLSFLVNAQETPKTESLKTAKEVIDRFISVVGYTIAPYQNTQTVSIQKTNSYTTKTIEVVDLSKETFVRIQFFSVTKNILRILSTKEKAYTFMEDGKVMEGPSTFTPNAEFRSDYRNLSNETILLPVKETFDGEEAYVLKLKEKTNQSNTYLYYSVKTGLHIGTKLGDSPAAYFYFKDYNLVDNKYLLPHKYVNSNNIMNGISVIKYNVDVEQFKNKTFKYPEEAIAAIPDEPTLSVFNELAALQENKNPKPINKDWLCYYVEGKPETWNLEKHINNASIMGDKSALNLSHGTYTKSGMKYSLEGSSSGVVIKSFDAFSFLIRKGNQYSILDSLLTEERRKESIEFRRLKLYLVKSEKNERIVIDNRDREIQCTIEKLPNDIERITPAEKLKKGEYVFFSPGIAFTFRVED